MNPRVLGAMLSRSRRGISALALALLQLSVSVLAPAADAGLEATSLIAPAHAESPGNEDCPVHHDHVLCQVVRTFSASIAVDGGPEFRAAASVVRVPVLLPAGRGFGAPILLGAAGPRAPPLA